ncbi:transcriptional regulator [Lysobacteraceae bacterium NML120232]|nr:transcriptional regulator [Xanthomonadaceae bacterium NML08-0793]PJK10850.1 transcriptional regulator [Xanthomonadaceae bacterium NML120232]
MSSLLRIRAERDQMSAVERRICDYILENAHFLRDYSSQQLADALGISQSSIVKFAQKLGFKGYPDLKFSIGESLARNGGEALPVSTTVRDHPHARTSDDLWQRKSAAEQETRLLNPPEQIDAIARALLRANAVFVIGLGEDGIPARAFAMKLSLLGILAVHHFDPALMAAGLSGAGERDVLLVFSEQGQQPMLGRILQDFKPHIGAVISVTRHSPNPLRMQAHHALLVSAHDERPHIAPLLYQAALQHLLDLLFVLLCEARKQRREAVGINLERMQELLRP